MNEAELLEFQARLTGLEKRLAALVEDSDALPAIVARDIQALDKRMDGLEPRLAGLENMAIDAIGTARKCITGALERHENRLDALEKIKSDGKVAGGAIKYGLTRARRLIRL